eukprot:6460389-Amphidinium_carterae.1
MSLPCHSAAPPLPPALLASRANKNGNYLSTAEPRVALQRTVQTESTKHNALRQSVDKRRTE